MHKSGVVVGVIVWGRGVAVLDFVFESGLGLLGEQGCAGDGTQEGKVAHLKHDTSAAAFDEKSAKEGDILGLHGVLVRAFHSALDRLSLTGQR